MLIAQVRHEREKPGKFREIIFPKNEKQFHRQGFVAEKIAKKFEEGVLGLRGLGELLPVLGRFLEQGHEFFELVEDEERRAAFVFDAEPRAQIRGGKHEPCPRFIIRRKTRGQKRRGPFVGERETFDDKLGARLRLDAQSFREKTFVEHRGDEAGVDHGRFAHTRFAVEQRPAINRDQANEPPDFVAPLEEDRAIDETELLDPAIRFARPGEFRERDHTGIGVFLIRS